MKNETSRQIRVGIFVMVSLALSLVVIFMLGALGTLFEKHYHLRAQFNNTSGLGIGSPVYLGGINIGKVEKIQFPKDLGQKQIMITLEIKQRFQDRIRQDSTAAITTQGLLGDKAVFITVGSPQFAMLRNEEEIKIKEGFSFDAIAEKGEKIVDNINELTTKASDLLDDIQNKESLFHSLFYDPNGAKIIDDTAKLIKNTDSIIHDVKNGRGLIHALVYDKVSSDVGQKFSKTVDSFQDAAANFKGMSDKIKNGEGTIGAFINDPTVYNDLMTLLGNANRNKLLRTVIRATLSTNEKELSAQ